MGLNLQFLIPADLFTFKKNILTENFTFCAIKFMFTLRTCTYLFTQKLLFK